MQPGGRKEGLLAPLFYLTAAIPLLLYQSVPAQTVDRSDLELCASLETAELKLVCFEAIIAASKTEEIGSVPEAMPTVSQSVDVLNSTLAAHELPATGRETAKTAATPTMQGPDDSFGEEYIERAAKSGKNDVILATVTSVQRRHNRKLYFQLANGQLWRQMERGYIQHPRTGAFEVEINQGMMGDYQLRVGGKGRMTRIVRVE